MKSKQVLIVIGVIGVIIVAVFLFARSTPDVKDPQQVVKAYLKAVIVGDYERASAFCEEDRQWSRERQIEELKRLQNGTLFYGGEKVPPLPKHPQIRVSIDGNTAEATIENWEYEDGGIELVFRGGRWWITR